MTARSVVYAPDTDTFVGWARDAMVVIEFDNAANEAVFVDSGVEYRARLAPVEVAS